MKKKKKEKITIENTDTKIKKFKKPLRENTCRNCKFPISHNEIYCGECLCEDDIDI